MTDSELEARKYSFRLLSYRGRSESELRDRLSKKGFSEDVTKLTVEFLRSSGYVDDVALAENLKRQAFANRLLGFEGARKFLMSRGLPRDVVDSVLNYDEDNELLNLQKLIDKRLKSLGNYLSEDDVRRLYNFLSRRGYSFSIIKRAIRDLKSDKEPKK